MAVLAVVDGYKENQKLIEARNSNYRAGAAGEVAKRLGVYIVDKEAPVVEAEQDSKPKQAVTPATAKPKAPTLPK